MKNSQKDLLCFCLNVIINSLAMFGFINIVCITFYINRDIIGVSIISFVISIFCSVKQMKGK